MTSRTKKTPARLALVAAIAFAAGWLGAHVAAPARAAAPQDEAIPPEAQAMIDAMTPGKHHRHLDQLIGEWAGTFTMRESPDAEPVAFDGTVTREWILDGRYVRETVTAETEYGPFHGLGFIGYNNLDGRYEVAWMDDKGTGIDFETGTYHADEKVMHMRGTTRDPVTGRLVNSWGKLDASKPNRHTYTGYMTDADGRTYKAFEGVLERVLE